jgi:(2Fe-2S) ferredoxin
MPMFERHVFVCENVREKGHPRGSCGEKGGEQIRELFKKSLEKRGLKGRMRANKAGCLDQCEIGPTVVVYPDGVWYGLVRTAEDVEEIVEQHLLHGRVVERLQFTRDATGKIVRAGGS